MKKKTLTIAIALVLVVALAVGATWAYLTAQTKAVTNTFTAGGAVAANDLTLKEHVATPNTDGSYKLDNTYLDEGKGNSYVVLPGVNLPKDPTVKVTAANGPYYLFVEVTKGTGFDEVTVGEGDAAKTGKPLDYTIAANWDELSLTGKDETREVYVYYVTGTDSSKTYIQNAATNDIPVLLNDRVTVNADNDIIATLTAKSDANLTFQAYACQAAGFKTAAEAFTACFGAK